MHLAKLSGICYSAFSDLPSKPAALQPQDCSAEQLSWLCCSPLLHYEPPYFRSLAAGQLRIHPTTAVRAFAHPSTPSTVQSARRRRRDTSTWTRKEFCTLLLCASSSDLALQIAAPKQSFPDSYREVNLGSILATILFLLSRDRRKQIYSSLSADTRALLVLLSSASPPLDLPLPTMAANKKDAAADFQKIIHEGTLPAPTAVPSEPHCHLLTRRKVATARRTKPWPPASSTKTAAPAHPPNQLPAAPSPAAPA